MKKQKSELKYNIRWVDLIHEWVLYSDDVTKFSIWFNDVDTNLSIKKLSLFMGQEHIGTIDISLIKSFSNLFR
jgi:hypothetical protein